MSRKLKLPNNDRAIIDRDKLEDYLLSPSHPVGCFKALFFESLGYSRDQWWELAGDLRRQHLSQEVRRVAQSRYGKKYEIRANLEGPSGKSASVLSVWIVLEGEDFPRFVTAYPED